MLYSKEWNLPLGGDVPCLFSWELVHLGHSITWPTSGRLVTLSHPEEIGGIPIPLMKWWSSPSKKAYQFCTCYRIQNHHEVLLGKTASLRKARFSIFSFLSMLPLHLGLLPFSAAPFLCVRHTVFCHMAKVHAGWKPKQQGLFLSASDSCQDFGFAAIASLLKCNKIVLELSFESASKLFY